MMVSDEQAEVIVNDWVLGVMTGDKSATVSNLLRILRGDGPEVDELRAKVAGWHFAREALTEREREILTVAEALQRIIDGEDSAQ